RIAALAEALIGFPPRGSKLRLALRHAVVIAAICTVALVIAMGLHIAVTGHWSEWLSVARLPSVLSPVAMPCLRFSARLLGQSMTASLLHPRPRNGLRLVALCVAAWLLVPTWLLVWCYALTGLFAASLLGVAPLLVTGLLAPVALVLAVRACLPEI